jgi:eukaryotic-like serine/threonine-protein kinase
MGAVYHAWDEELGVGVAMKVILPAEDEASEAAEEMERRFKKELILARQITHRNVVRIHDIGEVGGIKFITMPYIKGEDLATILKSGPLEIPRVLKLARQVVSGLGAAHDAGVIHRDLKPANIMVEEGEWALLMDFGIARSVRGGTSHTGTIAGTVVGTIDYMAPEQARGEPVDARSDVYAFGLIFYEMLTGPRQLVGDSAVSDLMARMNAAPKPVRALRPEIPDALDAIVTRCLQPSARDRYQNTAELLAALDGLDSEGRALPNAQARGLTPKLVAMAAGVIIAVAGTAYWTASQLATGAEVQRAPVSVLIADFDNRTGDPVFDGTLAQSLSLAMEGASFVTMFGRGEAVKIAQQLRPGGSVDEQTARLIATREGVGVVLAGRIERADDEYALGVRVLEGASGKEITRADASADSKEDVLEAVTLLAANVRRTLGDTVPESEQLAAAETFTSHSLEAAKAYETAQMFHHTGKPQDAIIAFRRAIALDPSMGRAYAGLAVVYGNLGRREEAEQQFKLAMARIDRMSERERLRTRTAYYLTVRNGRGAVEELTELVRRFPADSAGLGNLALAHFYLRDMPKALEIGRKATGIYPRNVVQRTNLALYAMYASDFETAAREAEAALKLNDNHFKATLALGLAHLGSGRVPEAVEAYTRLRVLNGSIATIGLADVALYEGRAEDAAAVLTEGVAADASQTSAAARKLALLAHARLLQGREAEAIRLAKQAAAMSNAFEVQVESALVYIDAGRAREAEEIAASLRTSLHPEAQAYSRVVLGLALVARNEPRGAVDVFLEGERIANTWLGKFGLGRAYLALGAYTEAQAAFEACLKRRGEAAAMFLDDQPTFRLLPPVHYYMGLTLRALRVPTAAESFKTFLAIKQNGDDPLVDAAKQQLAN